MKNYFYFIDHEKFLIADLNNCSQSDRTFDLSLFDIANNRKLLLKLKLWYLSDSFGATYTYDDRGEWFSCYLDGFDNHKREGFYEKAKSNPIVRLLIMDETLFREVSEILT